MPKWGNFVGAADEDLLAFALIMQAGRTLLNIAMYHLTQATEKYLKALVLSIIDPKGETETFHTQRRLLRTHDLVKLADFCGQEFPYYKRQDVRDNLKRFTFFDQAGRYPWTQDPILYVRFSTSDIPIFEEIVFNLRNDIPIDIDDYILGMVLRRSYHKQPNELLDREDLNRLQITVDSLRKCFRNPDGLVRH